MRSEHSDAPGLGWHSHLHYSRWTVHERQVACDRPTESDYLKAVDEAGKKHKPVHISSDLLIINDLLP